MFVDVCVHVKSSWHRSCKLYSEYPIHTSVAKFVDDQKGVSSTPQGRYHSFIEIYHEIFSTVILSLPLIQEGQLSVSGERTCTILVNRLED